MAQGYVYSFMDVKCGIVGPGGAFSMGDGAATAEEGITISPKEDINDMKIGADGRGMHSLRADKSGTVTVRLLKNSPVNQQLSALQAFQRSSSRSHGQNTISLVNTNAGDSFTCTQCAFARVPDFNFAKDGDMVEWQWHAIRIEYLLGAG